jgi:hypothetical protein
MHGIVAAHACVRRRRPSGPTALRCFGNGGKRCGGIMRDERNEVPYTGLYRSLLIVRWRRGRGSWHRRYYLCHI